MTTLSTTDTPNRDEIVVAFISVLECTTDEASFFLESALWNIEKAIHFWLDAAGNGKRGRSADYSHPTYASQGIGPWSSSHANFHPGLFVGGPIYNQKTISIVDLPPEWEARVNPGDGRIRFWHLATGHSQSRIPRAFSNLIGATIEGRTSVDGLPYSDAQNTNQSNAKNVSFHHPNGRNQMDETESSGGKELDGSATGSAHGLADDASIRADVGDEQPTMMNEDGGFLNSPRFDSQPSSVFASASAASFEAMSNDNLGGAFADDI
jgi:hypothetical protein